MKITFELVNFCWTNVLFLLKRLLNSFTCFLSQRKNRQTQAAVWNTWIEGTTLNFIGKLANAHSPSTPWIARVFCKFYLNENSCQVSQFLSRIFETYGKFLSNFWRIRVFCKNFKTSRMNCWISRPTEEFAPDLTEFEQGANSFRIYPGYDCVLLNTKMNEYQEGGRKEGSERGREGWSEGGREEGNS